MPSFVSAGNRFSTPTIFISPSTLAQAAEIIQSQPAALQLRYLQTLVEMAGEKNSTIIPLTVDIVNALSSKSTQGK